MTAKMFLGGLLLIAMAGVAITMIRGVIHLARAPQASEPGGSLEQAFHAASQKSNKLMRERVLWQGLTLLAFFLMLAFGHSK